MTDDSNDNLFTAELAVGTSTKKVVISELSMTSCVARLTFRVKPFQRGMLRLIDDKTDKPFKPIKTTIESVSQKKSDPEAYYTVIKFNDMVKANHGVVQLLKSDNSSADDNEQPVVRANKNSLRVSPVSCRMCAQQHIPFWALQSRSMLTKSNIFEVPSYVEALPRKDFCDFNLIRIIVCPSCYFASNDIQDFKKASTDDELVKPPFKKERIIEHWNANIEERRSLVEPHLNGFFSEERSLEQGLLSYDLAIITSNEIFRADEDKDPKRRNYNPIRKIVYYLLIKAEVLMINDRVEEAQKLLEMVLNRLEEIFPFLNNEPSIRAGFLMGMLGLYFEEYRKVAQNLTFLKGYNQDEHLRKSSDEYKTLTTTTKKLDEAFQNRDEYSKANLTRLQKPF